jgi:hypothetical protein
MKRFTRLSLAVLGAALSACGVEGAPADQSAAAPAASDDPAETAQLKVAETTAASGQTFKFYELGQRQFVISQSAPIGTMPMIVDQALWNEGDPVKIFQSISPDRPVPEALTAALARAHAAPMPVETTTAPTVADALAARQATKIRPVETTLAGTPAAASVATGGLGPVAAAPATGEEPAVRGAISATSQAGSVNCQTTFDLLQINGDLFCPANSSWSQCWHDAGSSIWQYGNARGGYSAVCAIGGTPRLNLIVNDANFPGVGFNVPAGTWRYVKTINLGECHSSGFPFYWTTCSHWHGFLRWEVPPAAGNWYDQGVNIVSD